MLSQELIILPFGVLPVVAVVGYAVYARLDDEAQRKLFGHFGAGTTEIPTVAAELLCGTNEDELTFSPDGKSLFLKIRKAYRGLPDTAAAQRYLREILHSKHSSDSDWRQWVDEIEVTGLAPAEQPDGYVMTITMPRRVVLTLDYIEHEIRQLGSVFTRNLANQHRWLLGPQGNREVEINDGRVRFRLERMQLVPGFLDGWKHRRMSERQITRNLKNRLWNQVDVRCVSLDDNSYCGEIDLA